MSTLSADRRGHLASCGWFWAWAAVGASLAATFVSYAGFLFLPLALLGWPMARRASIRQSAFGVITGAGTPFLLVAYIQRRGRERCAGRTGTPAVATPTSTHGRGS
jgi:hypothetical protein